MVVERIAQKSKVATPFEHLSQEVQTLIRAITYSSSYHGIPIDEDKVRLLRRMHVSSTVHTKSFLDSIYRHKYPEYIFDTHPIMEIDHKKRRVILRRNNTRIYKDWIKAKNRPVKTNLSERGVIRKRPVVYLRDLNKPSEEFERELPYCTIEEVESYSSKFWKNLRLHGKKIAILEHKNGDSRGTGVFKILDKRLAGIDPQAIRRIIDRLDPENPTYEHGRSFPNRNYRFQKVIVEHSGKRTHVIERPNIL